MPDSGKIETKDGKYYRSSSPRYGEIATKDGGRGLAGQSLVN